MGGDAHAAYSLGALSALGGAMGYAKARSLSSLAGGLVIGAALVAGGRLIETGLKCEGHDASSAQWSHPKT